MQFQVALLPESLLAVWKLALVRHLIGMNPEMRMELIEAPEEFQAAEGLRLLRLLVLCRL